MKLIRIRHFYTMITLSQSEPSQTMTSKEIAELINKNHADVMRDIRSLIQQLDNEQESSFALSHYEQKLPNNAKKQLPMYLLTKEQVLLLVSGYNVNLRLAIIRRWEELEKQNKPKEMTRLEILTLALESEKRALEAEQKALEAQNKINILTHVNKTYNATEIAKELGLSSATVLNKLLCDMRVQYKSNDTYVLYSKYATLGYFDIKQEVLDNGKVIYHRKITQLGREFIIDLLNKVALVSNK